MSQQSHDKARQEHDFNNMEIARQVKSNLPDVTNPYALRTAGGCLQGVLTTIPIALTGQYDFGQDTHLCEVVAHEFIKWHYYSTIMSFYHIRSREQAKYKAVIHRSVLV